MKKTPLLFLLIFFGNHLLAQQINTIIAKGNEAYKKGDYKTAQQNYTDALLNTPSNEAAIFNLGNALHKQSKPQDAEKQFDEIISKTNDNGLKAKALYNKALSLIAQQNLAEAINVFKQSLSFAPTDNDTRENLQKAMNTLREQQKQPQKKQPQTPKKQPQQNKSKLTPQKAEQYLKQLRDQEKNLQRQLQKQPDNDQPEEDW